MPSVTQEYDLSSNVKINSKHGTIIINTKNLSFNDIQNTFYTFEVKNKYVRKNSIITLTTIPLTIDDVPVSIPQLSVNSINHRKFNITFHILNDIPPGAYNAIDNNMIIYFNIL